MSYQWKHWSRAYTWYCSVRQVEAVLKKVRPYLVTKAREADVALEFLRLPMSKPGGSKGSTQIPASLQRKRESCFRRLRALKTRSKFRKDAA